MSTASSGAPQILRVALVDSNELFRRGLAALLDTVEDVASIGAVGTAEDALALVQATSPDVLFADVALGRDSGVDLCAAVKETFPDVKVVMLTNSESGADLYAAVQAGASGYLLKSSSFSQVAEAVRAVSRGQSMISPVMASTLLEEFKKAEDPDQASLAARRLSGREVEVLVRVARGLNNRDVGKDLGISENTVKNHMRSILDKLNLHSRTEAAMYAVREHLVDL